MLVCVTSKPNIEIQFDIKKLNITLMAIFVTHIVAYILFTCNVLELKSKKICVGIL